METSEESKLQSKIKKRGFRLQVIFPVIFRLILIYFPQNLNFSLSAGNLHSAHQPPSPQRCLLMQDPCITVLLCYSQYSGRSLLEELKVSPVMCCADIFSAMLICAIGWKLQMAYRQSLKSLDLSNQMENSDILPSGDIAALVYLWNPFTIVACVGLSTSPIENLFMILTPYGACTRLVPLAAFGWVMATHLSLYPAILIIPVILLLGYGPDAPPQKLFLDKGHGKIGDNHSSGTNHQQEKMINQSGPQINFSWRPVIVLDFFAVPLCLGSMQLVCRAIYQLKGDVSKNIWVHSYSGGYVTKYWCSLFGDSAQYLGLWGLFLDELADMQLSFLIFCGYVGVSLLNPVVHNLWIWRGTGNANFYFATAITYACLQIILVVESISAVLKHDRKLRKLSLTKLHEEKS